MDVIQIEGVTPSAQIREQLAAEGRPVVLAFSRGKDSIAAWLALRDAGIQVVPFYRYQVPRLRLVEESLDYFERFFGTKILRIPHVSLWRTLDAYCMQPPHRCRIIDFADIAVPSYRDSNDLVCEHFKLPVAETWVCDGVRATDTPDRRRALKMYGPINENERQIHIVWDWRVKQVWGAMEAAGVETPPDYRLFKRSLDGLDARYYGPLLREYPDDAQRMLAWFPMLGVEIFRRNHLSRRHPKLPRVEVSA